MYINLWDWFRNYERQARLKGDKQRMKLMEIAVQGWRYMRAERMDEAKTEFERGVQAAIALDELWWEIFFEYRICEVCERLSDYQETLDRAVKLVTKLRRDSLAEHPYRASSHMMVVWGYYLIDACGYRAEIEEAMAFIEDNIPMDKVTHMEIHYIRSGIYHFFEEYDSSYQQIMRYMDAAQGDSGEEKRVYQLLSDHYFATGKLEESLGAEELCAHHSGKSHSMRWEAIAIGWQSVRLAWMGQMGSALRKFEEGKSRLEALNLHRLTPSLSTHYLIACGRDTEAWEFSEKAMKVAIESGSLDKILTWHRTRGYLLNRLGRSVDNEMKQAHELVQKFRTPACHIPKLADISAGRPFAYDWQIKHWEAR